MSADSDDGTSRIAIGAVLAYLGLNGAGAGAAFFLVGASLAATFTVVFGLPFHDWSLDDRSQTCTGTIASVQPTPNFQINSEGTVVLQYDCTAVPDHWEWETRVVESDPVADLREGDPVIVEYLPDDPDVARIQGSRAAPAGWVGLGALAFAALGTVVCLLSPVVPIVGIVVAADGLRRRRSSKAARGAVSSINA